MEFHLCWLWGGKPKQGVHPSGCLACGRCCDLFGGHLQASKADLERWRTLGRDDLLQYVNRLGWIWIDPASGKPLTRCPHLLRRDDETTVCAIHEVKPEICRAYPTLAHGRRCLRGVFLTLPVLVCEILAEELSLFSCAMAGLA